MKPVSHPSNAGTLQTPARLADDAEKELSEARKLAEDEGARAVKYLSRARKAESVVDAAKRLERRGFFAPSTCADAETAADMASMCSALAQADSPQCTEPGPVTQTWVHGIPMMQQSVLLAAIRGPDGLAKYGGGAKMLLRWYRRCILLSAMDKRVLANPIEPNGGSFTGPSLDGPDDVDHWSERMQVHVNDYLRQVDALPHHYQLHFLHAVEILGYKHPDAEIRFFWNRLYERLVHDFHLWPETEEQLDSRLGDTRSGWLKRADPATTA
jgi:hypothetical protein